MEEKINVLLVDDDSDYRELMSFWLKAKGYGVLDASSGEQAIQIVKEQNPHIIFLDIIMPNTDGIETLRRIREFNQELPVIMVTAYSDEEYILETQKLNIAGFFAKDDDFSELRTKIESTLKNYKKIWKKS